MKNKKPVSRGKAWREAEEALAAAQQMPWGPKRVAALKKAGQLRFEADERRRIRRERREFEKSPVSGFASEPDLPPLPIVDAGRLSESEVATSDFDQSE